MEYTIVKVIQAMLAPGLMISACGLLILGMNNKYSIVVNRIRLLNDEKRQIHHLKNKIDEDFKRESLIKVQINRLNERVVMVRNAVFAYSIAVACFIVSSLFIGMNICTQSEKIEATSLTFFLIGMLTVLVGVIFGAKEALRGYKIVRIEIEEVDNIN
ncbi:MAG: DUF2721 domain-containing protein [Bacteroidales bacterium]|nr:DUF2721 domain-containing protein [Bacteroidales bacterium]